jgi:hypothetical protein
MMNKEIMQIATVSLFVLFSSPYLLAAPVDNEIAMASCTRTTSDDNDDTDYYDDEYEDETADNQDQSWTSPVWNKPEYYFPESTEQSVEIPASEKKGAARKSIERENAYSASN